MVSLRRPAVIECKGKHMKRKDENQRDSQMIIRLDRNVHMEAKAQAAYRNQSMQDYVIEAIMAQIALDKKYREEE